MLKRFYKTQARQWVAVFSSALLVLAIIVSHREYAFRTIEQPHIGQERGDESSIIIIVNAPTMYRNASPGILNYQWRPG